MKIVFSDLPMKKELHSVNYKVDGNKTIEYDGEIIFPVNSVLAKTMQKGEKVKIVLLSKKDIEGNSKKNEVKFKEELNEINRNIGADIEYVSPIETPFTETRDVHKKIIRDMVATLEDNAEIIGDVTYGPKPLPIIMFAVMNFAEKFFKANIKNIIYGKVDFVDDGSGMGKTKPINPVIYDLTPLYYLNNLTKTMSYKSSSDAVKALDSLLNL